MEVIIPLKCIILVVEIMILKIRMDDLRLKTYAKVTKKDTVRNYFSEKTLKAVKNNIF